MVVSAATAIALGTYTGGWRIIRTMGTRIIKMDPAQGFSAQGAGAAVILASSHFGFPLSTTQVIAGGVMGAGAGKRLSAVRWGVAGNIVVAWLLTLPAAAAIGGATYGVHPPLRHGRGRARWSSRRSGSALVAIAFARRDRAREPGAGGMMRDDRRHRRRCWRRSSPRSSPASGSTFVFSLAILGAARFAEANREGRSAARGRCSAALAVVGAAGDGGRGRRRHDRDDDASDGAGARIARCERCATSRSSRCWR